MKIEAFQMTKKCLRLAIVVAGCLCSLSSNAFAGAIPALTDIHANFVGGGSAFATAAHGVFTGNDVGAGTDNLLGLLNFGTSPMLRTAEIYKADGTTASIRISSTGMFSTSNTVTPVESIINGSLVDLIVGTPVNPTTDWSLVGTTNAGIDEGPFQKYGTDVKSGTLTLQSKNSPMSGNLVVALKAGNYYAVYAFASIVSVESFTFSNFDVFKKIDNDGTVQFQTPGLSHASLYYAPTNTVPPADVPTVPEPSSLAVFVAMSLFGSGTVWKRRR